MPPPNQVSHRNIQNMALPYKSWVSPTESEVFYCSGSSDLMTSGKSYIQRRPGFGTSLETSTPTQFNNVVRIFTWNKWDGTFIVMVNDINASNQSVVSYMRVGIDTKFQFLYVDSTSLNPFWFVVSNNTLYFSNGHVNVKWDGVPADSVRNWGITAPASAPTISTVGPSGLNIQVGWKYVYCYYNSATGHLSSPSPVSASTGTVSCTSVSVSVTASTDPQVTNIRIFRTTDGGGGNFFEIPASPAPNTTTSVGDTALDSALSIITAPTPTFNDPPPVWNFMTYWNGRIWGVDATKNNTLWFTGLEEITIGVPEESLPSGVAGNFWTFDEQIVGTMSLPGSLIVECPGRVYSITGDTLDTFRRTLISNRRGSREPKTMTTISGMGIWRDSSTQIWGTDGTNIQEVGQDIRTDLATIPFGGSCMTAHVQGEWHWLVFASGTRLFVYDFDLGQWMPPWNVAATFIYSGEIAAGQYVLLASINNKIYYASPTVFTDPGGNYSWSMFMSTLNMVPDFGKRFSFIAQGSYDQPSRLGKPWMVAFDRNNAVASVKVLVDEDPTQPSSWTQATDITSTYQTSDVAFNRQPGTNMVQDAYLMAGTISQAARRISVNVNGNTAATNDKIYSLFLGYGEQR